ncbi:helix-turn-helix domain-containing protein [Nocardioides sp. CFH 31398]|uniref:helix-turn-helix domain-containing protein n=1 Tax=Nocardioides sp. CFH 31398 TaxID=2919579 RepID=UPI001F06C48F|nr:helix-turn-helix domain-containing protein [Nocardioides sp. CFH 31398]MCH1866201.1 helix-turn-helix domain-containing protein [Nocardioides sp. CFH 31398]
MTEEATGLDARTAHRAVLGRTVRELRLARGLTVRGLAGALGVSPATLSAVENGRTGVSSARVASMAAALEVPVQRLLAPGPGGTGPSPVPVGRPVDAVHGDWRVFEPLVLPAALAGALSSFLEFGYHGATMRTIAERAGLSVPGLYHHHASKHEMLVAILDLTMTDLVARATAARDEGDDAVTRFALLVECLALFHTHRRDLGFVGYSEMRSLEPAAHARVAAVRRGVQHLVDVEVEDAVAAGHFGTDRPHEAARAVVTMTTAMPQWFRPDGPASAEEVAAQHVRFALDLVRHRGGDTGGAVPTIGG